MDELEDFRRGSARVGVSAADSRIYRPFSDRFISQQDPFVHTALRRDMLAPRVPKLLAELGLGAVPGATVFGIARRPALRDMAQPLR